MADPTLQAKTEDQLKRLNEALSQLNYHGIPITHTVNRKLNGGADVAFQFPLEYHVVLLEIMASYLDHMETEPGEETDE